MPTILERCAAELRTFLPPGEIDEVLAALRANDDERLRAFEEIGGLISSYLLVVAARVARDRRAGNTLPTAKLPGRAAPERAPPPTTCAQIEPLLAACLRGSEVCPTAVEHLVGCPACTEVAMSLREIAEAEAEAEAADDEARGAARVELPEIPYENYVVGGEVGRGGMGRILYAHDRRLGREVAIKELLDDRHRARFEHEARLTARLQHPAIVNVYEAGRWPDGRLFYTMKFVAGRPLSTLIKEQHGLALLPNIIAVAEAVAYAHSRGIVHRDLKPQNILVGEFGETVVIDWGLAKDLDEVARGVAMDSLPPDRPSRPELTQAGAGTPRYMPPEQAEGRSCDPRVDVYAIGATLYHALSGLAPYGGGSVSDVLARARCGGPTPLGRLCASLPRPLLAIVEKAMALDPADRYPSAATLADDLKRFQAGQRVAAYPYSLRELTLRALRNHATVARLSLYALTLFNLIVLLRNPIYAGVAVVAAGLGYGAKRAYDARAARRRLHAAPAKKKELPEIITVSAPTSPVSVPTPAG